MLRKVLESAIGLIVLSMLIMTSAHLSLAQTPSPASKNTTQRVGHSYDVKCLATSDTATVATGLQDVKCSTGQSDDTGSDDNTIPCGNGAGQNPNCYPVSELPPRPIGGNPGGVGISKTDTAWKRACVTSYEAAVKACRKGGARNMNACISTADAREKTCAEAEANSEHPQPGDPNSGQDSVAVKVPLPPKSNDFCGEVEFRNMAYCSGFSKDNFQVYKSCLARTQEATALCRKENPAKDPPR